MLYDHNGHEIALVQPDAFQLLGPEGLKRWEDMLIKELERPLLFDLMGSSIVNEYGEPYPPKNPFEPIKIRVGYR